MKSAPKPSQPKRRHSLYLRSLVLATFGSVLVAALILLARFHWRLEMLSHFRLPFAIGLLFLLILLICAKIRKLSIFVGVCLLLQVIPLSHHYLPFLKDSREGNGPEFKVITFNMLTRNQSHSEVMSFLETQDADFIGLQEISQEWKEALEPLRKTFPYTVSHPRGDNFGLLVFSKYPITTENLDLSQELATPYLQVEVDWQGQPLSLVVAHPPPPMTHEYAQARNNTFARFQQDLTQASKLKSPVIVMGDLNCSAYSPHFSEACKGLLDSSRGRGYPATWHRGHPILGIPIDHILYSDSLVCRERKIGPRCGSDHSPITATFQRKQP